MSYFPTWFPPKLRSEVIARMSEPHRQYHTVEHIKGLVRDLSLWDHLSDSHTHKLIMSAAWFHDIVYDPTRRDNEEASAEFFIQCANRHGATWSTDDIANITTLILATKEHMPQMSRDYGGSIDHAADADLFLSLDLMVLASDWWAFTSVTNLIRMEYGHVSDLDFYKGRLDFLEQMLGREAIFPSSQIEAAMGERARENLRREAKIYKELYSLEARNAQYTAQGAEAQHAG